MKSVYLTKINDELYKYNEPFEIEGVDYSIKFSVRFNGSNWYTTFMDVEGEDAMDVVEQVFELMNEYSL